MTSEQKIISFIQFQVPSVAWSFFIFTASSIPSQNISMLPGFSDKMVHAGVFGILCWLLHIAFFHQGNMTVKKYSLMIAIVITSLYGLSDEYHQMFTPGRSTEVYDLLADTAGAVVYAMAQLRFKFYRHE